MFTRVSWKVLGVALGFLVAAASVTAWSPIDRLTYLTFSRSVALPGVTLAAGTYAFEIANPLGDGSIVCVRDKGRQHAYYMGMTLPIDRPAGLKSDQQVLFGEPSSNQPPPIVAWFPPDDSRGRQFIYRK